jgi:hypothetical protein
MRKTLIEKAEIEEKLKESEYTRANYRRDFESSQHELTPSEELGGTASDI